MARYIDADALIKVLDAKANMAMGTPKEVFFSVSKMVDYLPPADVAPRAEVAREIFEEIERFLESQEAISENKRLKEVGDWIFHDYLPTQLAELKKKYTQPEPPKGD